MRSQRELSGAVPAFCASGAGLAVPPGTLDPLA